MSNSLKKHRTTWREKEAEIHSCKYKRQSCLLKEAGTDVQERCAVCVCVAGRGHLQHLIQTPAALAAHDSDRPCSLTCFPTTGAHCLAVSSLPRTPIYSPLKTTMAARLEQVTRHLSNSHGRGLLNGEVAIITGTYFQSSKHTQADQMVPCNICRCRTGSYILRPSTRIVRID